MEPTDRRKWMLKILAGIVLVAATLVGVATWTYSNLLRDELVTITDAGQPRSVEIATVGSGRITVAKTPATEAKGIWGVIGPNGYGQASVLIATTADTVERAFRTLDGSFDVGELVAFDPIAYQGDPLEAHGIEFDEVRFSGDLGVYPAWVIDGDKDTWVVVVHGAGPSQRRESLRIIPGLVAAGYPVMVTTVRGDEGAPPAKNGRRTLGTNEWRDLAAAIDYGSAQEANEFVLVGFDTGASIIATYLHEADDITAIRGVVYDSALLDPERIANRIAAEHNVPRVMRGVGKLLASIRFDIDWDELDQIDLAGEYTVPVLVMHGTADEVVAVGTAEEFAAAVGNLATFVEFQGGRHAQLWNADPTRYEDALHSFIEDVSTP